jgi:hypothetical protein
MTVKGLSKPALIVGFLFTTVINIYLQLVNKNRRSKSWHDFPFLTALYLFEIVTNLFN